MYITIGGLGDSQYSLLPWKLELDNRYTPNTYLGIRAELDKIAAAAPEPKP